jgi:amino acid adenylation domain-containing protein
VGAYEPLFLSEEVERRLTSVLQTELEEILLAACAVLLYRYTDERDLILGFRVGGEEALPCRIDLSGDPAFQKVAATVSAAMHRSWAHRGLSRTQFAELGLGHFAAVLEIAGDEGSDAPVTEPAAECGLALRVARVPQGLQVSVKALPEIFDEGGIARFLRHYARLVHGTAAKPASRISELPVLEDAEVHALVYGWNDTRQPIPEGTTLHGLFEAQAARAPEALALIAGSQRHTYREMEEQSRSFAAHLQALGAGPETRVAVCLERSAGLVVAILGILRTGAAYVPLDPAYPEQRLALILEDSSPSLIVTSQRLAACMPAARAPMIYLESQLQSLNSQAVLRKVEVDADNLAYVIYTSGSTGQPKGVAIRHCGPVALVLWETAYLGVEKLRKTLASTSVCFDVSVSEIFAPLACGAAVVLVENALALLELPVASEVTMISTVPSAIPALLRDGGIRENVTTVVLAGEPLPVSLVRQIYAQTTVEHVYNFYGPTEDTVFSTAALAPREISGPPAIGFPIANGKTYVLDPKGNPMPAGLPGELYLGGAGVGRGYLGRPDLTAERFVPNPWPDEPGERLYRTGDLARYRSDGQIDFLGRLDHQVKVRGFRIETAEVEAAIESHPSVAQALVIADGDGDERRLIAYTVPVAGHEIPATHALRKYLGGRLPAYMVPAGFVRLESFPLGSSGKIDRRALPRPAIEQAFENAKVPVTPLEQAIAAAWSAVLGQKHIGLHDSFFDLGGHSLTAVRALSRLRSELGVDLPLRLMFELPTVAALAGEIEPMLADRSRPPAAEPQLVAQPHDRPMPLTYAQQGLWFLAQLAPESPFYNVPMALDISGPLDREALSRSLAEVVRRHEVLRTAFGMVQGAGVQMIQPATQPPLPCTDLSAFAPEERERRAAALEYQAASTVFELSRGLLLSARLLRHSDTRHTLVLVVHHLAIDGWSIDVMLAEIAELYAAFSAAMPSPLLDLPVQYADFALWQRSLAQSQTHEAPLAYWCKHLAGAPPVHELPTDRPRPAIQSYRGATHRFRLPAPAWPALSSFSQRQGATAFMAISALWNILLLRLSGRDDLVVGSPVAKRNRAELEALMGLFVNMAPLRARIDPDRGFRSHLAAVRETALAAFTHHDFPFGLLVEELAPERDLSRNPLFQVALVHEGDLPGERRWAAAVSASYRDLESGASQFDLSLHVADDGDGLACRMVFSHDLFDLTTIERFAGHLTALLTAAASEPERAVADLPWLAEAECEQLLTGWNRTATDYPREESIPSLFARIAAACTDEIALEFVNKNSGSTSLTYGELDQRSNQLARRLRRLGIGPDRLVAVLMERSLDLPVALLGVLKAGGAYLPLDPGYPKARLALMLRQASPACLLTTTELEERLPEFHGPLIDFDRDRQDIAAESSGPLEIVSHPLGLAYVMYTSGSTGEPKGTAAVHRGIVRLVRRTDFAELSGQRVYLQLSPVSFDASTLEIWGPLLNGGRLVLMPPGHASLDDIGRAVREHQVDTLWLTAGLFHLMAQERLGDLAPLRQLLAGGDVLSPALVEKVRRELPHLRLINGYGPTENTTFTCCHTIDAQIGGSVPIGRPIANTRVYIYDQRLQPVPAGVAGELYIGGDGLARGYYRRADLTAERFVPNPHAEQPGDRLYQTGDLVRRRPDGVIEFLGRADRQVKIRGFRIELGEIEAALGEAPGVREAVAVAREDTPGGRQLVAYVITEANQDHPGMSGALRDFLGQRLPEYMVPARFVWMDSFPLTANGKVDRRALPAPGPEGPAAAPPRSPVEEMVASVWHGVLGHNRFGIQDSFFVHGGHSLTAIQVVSRLRDTFGVSLPVRAVFEHPTIEALARRVSAALSAGTPAATEPLARVPRNRPLPLSLAQQGLWVLAQLAPESPFYNVPVALDIEGPLDAARLAHSLAEVVRRHEVLRTTFAMLEGSAVQVIHDPAPMEIPCNDLSDLSAEKREDEAERLTLAEALTPFDLIRGPLLRARLIRRDSGRHVLVLTLHHIISDGWSVDVLLSELAGSYQAASAGETRALPELPLQYGDFAVWQRSVLTGGRLSASIAEWKERLAGAPAVQDLPGDRPRPAVQSYRGAVHLFHIHESLRNDLQSFARHQGATLFMALFAGFKALLMRLSGREDLVTGSPVANRGRSEFERLAGFFVSMLPLRVQVNPDAGFHALLRSVRDVALAAYSHQEVPFEIMVEELAPARDLSRNPVFQIAFALQTVSPDLTLAPGLTLTRREVDWKTSHFDITLHLWDHGNELVGRLVYSTDLFDEQTAARLAGCLQTLLAGLLAEPSRPVSELPLLSAAEAGQLLAEWNAAAGDLPRQILQGMPEIQGFEGEPWLGVADSNLNPVPYGIAGEVVAGGVSVRGGASAGTAAGLVPFDALESHVLRTGERARWRSGGRLQRLGRIDGRVWIEGVPVDPRQVECVLLNLPGVVDSVVLPRDFDGRWQLVAYVVATGAWSPDLLRAHASQHLEPAAVPQAWVRIPAVPLTFSGEVDSDALGQLDTANAEQIAQWERSLEAQPGSGEVAIVTREIREEPKPLHLADLLPDWRRTAGSSQVGPVVVEETEEVSEGGPSISTGTPLPGASGDPRTLAEALLRTAARSSTRGIIYLNGEEGEERQTYPELLDEARGIARGLRSAGLAPGDRVVLQLDRNRDVIPVFWGCVLGGFVPVPIAVPPVFGEHDAAVQKVRNAWELLGQPLVVAGEAVAGAVRGISRDPGFRVVDAADLRRNPPDDAIHGADPDDLALLLLTSGSTGLPKAVQQSHAALLARSAGAVQLDGFTDSDVSLNWMPLDHVGGIVMFHLRDVWTGCEQIQAPIEPVLQRPLLWLDWIERYKATISWAPNFAYGLVADQVETASRRWDLSSMRFLLNGGEAIVARTARRFLSRLAPFGLPGTSMHPAWGMSETCSGVTSSHAFGLESTSDDDAFVEVGGPIPGISLRVVDNTDTPVPEGRTGRLQIKGATVTSGYFRQPELTQEVFTADGWFKTGDLAMLRGGRLTITGREKDVIIVNGINFYSHEIESVVEEIPEVEASFTAACGVRLGGDTDRLALFFTPRVSGDEALQALLLEIRGRVARRAGITPDYLAPVPPSEIPKTGIGKIQRPQLRQRFEAGEFEKVLRRVDVLMNTAQTLPDWFFRTIWRRSKPRARVESSVSERYLIFADRHGLGERLRELLTSAGHECVMVEVAAEKDTGDAVAGRYSVNPSRRDSYQSLFELLVRQSWWPPRVVHLWNHHLESQSAPLALDRPEKPIEAQERGALSILALVQALASARSKDEQVEIVVVTSATQAVMPGERLAIERATLPGLLKTIPSELPWLRCRHLDLEGEVEPDAARVFSEITMMTGGAEVAYRNGTRWAPRLAKATPRLRPGKSLPFVEGGFYLLSGGLGEMGRAFAAMLMQRFSARLLLVGRSEIHPFDEKGEKDNGHQRQRALAELARLPGEAVYESLDVAEFDVVSAAVIRAESRFGRPLDGVIHLAGVLGERPLLAETPESFTATLRAKVAGGWALHRLVSSRPNALFISCSSVNGFFGGSTVGAYAAANSFLDRLAHHQRAEGRAAWSIAWSRWDELGMSRSYGLKELAQAAGYRSISLKQGLESLEVALLGDDAAVTVGLDAGHSAIRRYLDEPLRPMERLAVCFTGELEANLVREQLAGLRYEMLRLPEIPRSESGVVDRARLTTRVQNRGLASVRLAPCTDTERHVAHLWGTLLGLSEVGVEDNFFEVGGHSLLATQLLARLRETLKIDLPLRRIFESPTVAGIAAAIDSLQPRDIDRAPTAPAGILPAARDGELPLSFSQQRLWFLDHFQPGNNFYNVPAAFRLSGDLNLHALESSLSRIVERHEALRTTIDTRDGRPLQCIHPAEPVRVRRVDLTDVPAALREGRARGVAQAEAERPFDLRLGPLFRGTLIVLEPNEHILILNLHHIVSDGWSIGVLVNELTGLYRSACTGETPNLPELPIQYADFAIWQRQYLAGDELARHLDYWRRHLQGAPPALDLPGNRPRPEAQRFRGSIYTFRLPAALPAALRALSQREGATLFMTLLAAFKVLLYRYTGQDDVVVGVGIANRNRVEVEPLIGFFVNTLAMRTSLAGNPAFRELLGRVREVAMGAFAHQDLPFEKLVEELRPERDLSRNPLVQVAFVLQNAPNPSLRLPGLTPSPFELEVAAAKFDLLLSLADLSLKHGEGEITGLVEFNSDIFDTSTIARMMRHYEALLAVFAGDPEQRLRMAPLFTDEIAAQLAIDAGQVRTVAPLNTTQRDLFLDHARYPESVIYSLGISARLPVAVDPRLWGEALAMVVAAEPVLRSRFASYRGEPLQIVEKDAPARFEVIDIEAHAGEDHDETLARVVRERVKVPYRLAAGGLFHGYLVRGLPGGGDTALLAFHHIVADAFSGRLLLERIAGAYRSLSAGRPCSPAPVEDFAFFNSVGESLARFDTPQIERFWSERLRHVGPFEMSTAIGRASRPARAQTRVSGERLATLRDFAANSNLSLAALMRGAFGLLLNRLFSPEGDLLIYDVVNGRTRDRATAVGCFHQVVPVVLPSGLLGDDQTLAGYLAHIRAYRRELGEAQNLSVLLERRLLTGMGLRFFYNFYNFAGFDLLGGRSLLLVHDSFPEDEVHLIVSDNGEELEVGVHWNERAFAGLALPERMIEIADQIARGIERLADISALLADERRQIAAGSIDTAVRWAEPANLERLLAAQEQRTPEAHAVCFDGETLSYRELHRRAGQLAHLLRGRGVGPDTVVAVAVERSFEMVIALLAVLKAGGAYLPLDPDYPEDRLRFMLSDSQAALLLVGGRDMSSLAGTGTPVLRLDAIAKEASAQPEIPPAPQTSEDHLAYVIYTSGSTGLPKGAMNTHGAIANRLLWMQRQYGLTGEDRVLQKTPLSFDVSVWEVFWPLITGACLVVARPEGHKDSAYLARLIHEQRVTTLHFVPSMLRIFLEDRGVRSCTSLRRVMASGEELSRDLVERHYARMPWAALHNLYGPTEAAVDVTFWECRHGEAGPVPIGRPVANTVTRILNRELRPVPAGVAGELCIGGAQLARGYLNRPGLTAERFMPDPCGSVPGARLYRTGDRACLRTDGAIEYLGRLDHQIKLRGFRIELGEIEAVLARVATVRQSLVLLREVEGEARLVAYLIGGAADDSAPSHAEITATLRGQLPDYMVPAHFVWLKEMPLLPNGKVNRQALPAPAAVRPDLEVAYAAAAGAREQVVIEIWQEVLGLRKVGALDNFFDLGGHSLLLVRVQDRLRTLYGHEIPMVELFRYPTARALAGYLNELEGVSGRTEKPSAATESPAVAAGTKRSTAVAIVGMAGRFPMAATPAELWQRLREGAELIRRYSDEELLAAGVDATLLSQPGYVPAKAELADVDQFDAAFFGYSPREAEILDPQQRLFLEAAWEALENAGYDPSSRNHRVGVFAGQSFNTYLMANLYPNARVMATVGLFQAILANDKDYLATRTSYKLGLTGPSLTVQTACSTSLVAIHLAVKSLLEGECEMALAGGVSVTVPVRSGYLYQPGSIVSPDGHCRAFDAQSQGTVPGNGLGIVVLKRLEDAQRDGDTIRAVILGSSINNDGSGKVGFTAPSPAGQAAVISDALARAGVEPETIGLIEAHGTGTPLGDPIEVVALKEVFAAASGRPGFIALGSIKSNLGHLDAAAGVAGIMKATLALENGELPPTLHVGTPNPDLHLEDSPFYLNARVSAWLRNGTPRRAAVSSFGIGGTNAHVVLQEAEAPMQESQAASWEAEGPVKPAVLVLSARTPSELQKASENLATFLRRSPEVSLDDVAWTLATGRHVFAHRRVVIGNSREQAIAALEGHAHERVATHREDRASRPVAFLFPGQGSQHVAMAAGLYEAEPRFREWLDRCAVILAPHLDLNLLRIVYPAKNRVTEAQEQLNQTLLTQPALFAIEYALARLWMDWGIRPAAMLGHSIGELVTAVLAGVMKLEDALWLISVRARLINAQPRGAMLAVSLGEEAVRPWLGGEVAIAALNSSSMSVVAGDEEPVRNLAERLTQAGIFCRRLNTSHAFHSHRMEPVLQPFAEAVSRIQLRPPEIPFISNTTGTWITAQQAVDPWYWARHLREPVRFSEGLVRLAAQPGMVLLEVGPGNTLSTLARAQLGETPGHAPVLTSLPHPRERALDLETMASAAGRLWMHGVTLDWAGYSGKVRRRRVPLPTYPFTRQRYWVEAISGSTAGADTPPMEMAAGEAPAPPAPDDQERAQPFEAPANEIEIALAAIWEELLGVRHIGRNDDFFELGGHSLMGVQLLARLGARFPLEIPIDLPFECPTIAEMAARIEDLLIQRLESISDEDAEQGMENLPPGERSAAS